MTLSAVDNPYALIGADRMGSEAAEKEKSSGGASSLFYHLLQGTSVQQVAYAGYAREFTQTLQLHDDTIAREDKQGNDRQKYEGIGLLDGGDNDLPDSSRAAKKIDDLGSDDDGKPPTEGPSQRAGPLDSNNRTDNGTAATGDGVEVAALGIPTGTSVTGETKSDGRTGGQNGTNTDARRTNVPNGQQIADLASKGGKENAATDELGRSRIANAAARNPANSNAYLGGAKVTEIQEDVVSQPASSLAASAALAAQTNRPGRTTLETPVAPAEDLAADGRVSLLNGNNGRTNGRQQTNAVQPQPKLQNANPGPQDNVQANANQQPANILFAQSVVTASAARADGAIQTGQTLGDPFAAGPSTNSSGQSAQRTQQPQAPEPPRPPVRPEQLTGQVAVQIKKAIGQGADHIRIQLKPAELGRVEVKLQVNEDGRASAIVTADRPDTLDMLQRDASSLRQALQDAGLSTDSNSLSFNLRGDGGRFGQQMAEHGHDVRGGNAVGSDGNGDSEETAEAAMLASRNIVSDGRVDVQI